jgi:hypothetical protein
MMESSRHFTRSIPRACTRIAVAAVLAPALVALAGFGSAALASTAASAAAQASKSGGTYSSLSACDYAGDIDIAVIEGYHSFTCTGTYDGPKGDETAVWTLTLFT